MCRWIVHVTVRWSEGTYGWTGWWRYSFKRRRRKDISTVKLINHNVEHDDHGVMWSPTRGSVFGNRTSSGKESPMSVTSAGARLVLETEARRIWNKCMWYMSRVWQRSRLAASNRNEALVSYMPRYMASVKFYKRIYTPRVWGGYPGGQVGPTFGCML